MSEINKKILFIRTPPYNINPNSYNIQQIGMGKAFCKRGFDFDFLTFKKGKKKEFIFYDDGKSVGKYIEVSRIRLLRTGINLQICKKSFLSNYDLIIVQEYYQIMSFLVSRNHSHVCIYSGPYWNMFFTKTFSKMYDLFFKNKINKNIKTIYTKSVLANNYLKDKGYEHLFNLGVALDTSKYENVLADTKTNEIVSLMETGKSILYIGNINENKNVNFLVKVFALLHRKDNNLKLILIGKCHQSVKNRIFNIENDNYLIRILSNYSDDLKKSVFHFENIYNSQLQYIYPKARVFVLPSKHEIFGMVMLESMYFGTPVVSSLNGGSSSLISDGENGYVLNNFDTDKWAEKISSIIYNDEKRSLFSQACTKKVRNDNNWEKLVDIIINNEGV